MLGMDHAQRIRQLDAALILRRRQLDGELGDRELRAMTTAGMLVRVMRGCYMERTLWDELHEPHRLLARTLAAAALGAARPPTFSHLSAAAVWNLPLYGLARSSPQPVHVLTPPDRPGRSRGAVIRHSEPYDESDITTVAGLRVTTLSRTVRDLARLAAPELALGCADRALRLLVGLPHARVGQAAQAERTEQWRESQLALLHERRGARGVRRARRIIELADPRADSVAESVSRLQLVRLKIPFDFQVAVAGLHGATHRMDFDFVGQACFGEMDGRIKYTDPAYRNGRTLEQVLLDEKEREDEVRGLHRKAVLRWGWGSIGTARRLGERLSAFGLHVPEL